MAPSGSSDDRDSLFYRQWISRVPGEYEWYLTRSKRAWRPPTDVYETDEHVVIKVEVAGVREDDFEISFVDRRLTIAGERRNPEGRLVYQNMEINYGEFRTEVLIQIALENSPIEATYEAGFLFIRLPKAREHRVQVRSSPDAEA
jgi:HSP20 family protein